MVTVGPQWPEWSMAELHSSENLASICAATVFLWCLLSLLVEVILKWLSEELYLTLAQYKYSNNHFTICICEMWRKINKHKNDGWNVQGRSCIFFFSVSLKANKNKPYFKAIYLVTTAVVNILHNSLLSRTWALLNASSSAHSSLS